MDSISLFLPSIRTKTPPPLSSALKYRILKAIPNVGAIITFCRVYVRRFALAARGPGNYENYKITKLRNAIALPRRE